MATLPESLQQLFPTAVLGKDIVLEDDGKTGPRVVKWNLAAAQPTAAQITQARTDADAAKTAKSQAAQQERDALDAALAKLNGGQTLTIAELSAVLKLLIRRTRKLEQLINP